VSTGTATTDSFRYCANGTTDHCTTVTLGAAVKELASGITLGNDTYASTIGARAAAVGRLAVSPPGVLINDRDGGRIPLTVDLTTVSGVTGPCAVVIQPDGSFRCERHGRRHLHLHV